MKEIIHNYSEQIKEYFNSFLDVKGESFNSINKWGHDVTQRLKAFSKNGKMIRGSLVLFTQEMFGGRIDTESIKAAAAIELFHSGLLIHDDIIDCDELRRGNPSMYQQYAQLGIEENFPDPRQFGVNMGICAGDMAFFIGFELISDLKIDNSIKEKILRIFTNEFTAVGLGQMQDIYLGESGSEPQEEDIFKLYFYKTARYTFSLPFMLGGLLADIADIELKNLEILGGYLGLIFQLKDDELGLFSEKSEFGKPIASDIEENKKTLFNLYLFQNADQEEVRHLRTIFGSANITDESIQYVKDIIKKYGIKEIIEKKIRKYKDQCEEIISGMSVNDIYKSKLNEIVEYNLNRLR